MGKRMKRSNRVTVADMCRAMDTIAPIALAQDWDNVGPIACDMNQTVKRAMLCIDLTHAVVDEAIKLKVDFIMAYHPPIFRPVSRLNTPGNGTETVLLRCIKAGISVYSAHTALDAAEGGTNDVLASLCGIKQTEPLDYVEEPGAIEYKLAIFVPEAEVETVAEAIFAAGGGVIGDYTKCSFRIPGRGSFFGGDTTDPTIGKPGKLEFVDEFRLECVVSAKALPKVVSAMIAAHSYEEPAYDIYPTRRRAVRGIGRVGMFNREMTLDKLARKLKKVTGAGCVQLVGDRFSVLQRAVLVVGAAGSLPFKMELGEGDVIVTGEIRHHDALAIERMGSTAIALGHSASERPALAHLARRLANVLANLDVILSEADIDPLRAL